MLLQGGVCSLADISLGFLKMQNAHFKRQFCSNFAKTAFKILKRNIQYRFTEIREVITSRVWLDSYTFMGLGADLKFLVTLTKQIEIVVEAEDLVSAKDEGEYLGNIELRDEIDRNKAVDWTLTKIEGI